MSDTAPPDPADLRYDTVTLLSDLGHQGGAVGVVHSVIRQLAPGVGIVDLSHDIAPFDVRAGALVLARSVQYLCPGVIVGMVDPGVGGNRKLVAVEVADGAAVLIGPDNGLLSSAVGMIGGASRAVVLDDVEHHLPGPSATFPGRDVLAPVAAALCRGVPLEDLGSAIDPALLMPGLVPLSAQEMGPDGEHVVSAEVLSVDRFGNVQLNVSPEELDDLGEVVQVRAGAHVRTAKRVAAYEELATGEVGLLVDSDGLVSVVADRHPAAVDLELATGDAITLVSLGDGPVGVRTEVQIGRRITGGTP